MLKFVMPKPIKWELYTTGITRNTLSWRVLNGWMTLAFPIKKWRKQG